MSGHWPCYSWTTLCTAECAWPAAHPYEVNFTVGKPAASMVYQDQHNLFYFIFFWREFCAQAQRPRWWWYWYLLGRNIYSFKKYRQMWTGRLWELQRLHLYLQLITCFRTRTVLAFVLKKSYQNTPLLKIFMHLEYSCHIWGMNNQ